MTTFLSLAGDLFHEVTLSEFNKLSDWGLNRKQQRAILKKETVLCMVTSDKKLGFLLSVSSGGYILEKAYTLSDADYENLIVLAAATSYARSHDQNISATVTSDYVEGLLRELGYTREGGMMKKTHVTSHGPVLHPGVGEPLPVYAQNTPTPSPAPYNNTHIIEMGNGFSLTITPSV